ncbi:hypothetical protein GCM10010486_53960 [Nonomuraea roseoviolacea subsp. carminata]
MLDLGQGEADALGHLGAGDGDQAGRRHGHAGAAGRLAGVAADGRGGGYELVEAYLLPFAEAGLPDGLAGRDVVRVSAEQHGHSPAERRQDGDGGRHEERGAEGKIGHAGHVSRIGGKIRCRTDIRRAKVGGDDRRV